MKGVTLRVAEKGEGMSGFWDKLKDFFIGGGGGGDLRSRVRREMLARAERREVFTAAQVAEISKLPSKEVLVAQMLGIIQSPMRGIVVCVNGVMQGLVIALEEIRKKKEAAGG